ncbi:hypothetical protein [Vibrio parahaemolyticus]|uniref:hypothetical protein n=1 Tax=Vibrio parahaemolyticus TaxID=670 RepID=UPI000941D6C6|nr:hypothetical protein [Vibrio parahaemolyticus]MBE3687223.1 hypothetical protein [Vibrio parahaemolyticus]MBE3803972.1 hypothetical protein [Vibrio parahaemolyticus]MBE3808194.1 hypothetical protein [Vibrio parahaemolyticus]MBE4230044.1 hypothetical protein [Vibrio parahaemolyticus]MBE4394860.1 hypothetical protein [Vibrio parahaemolyticus]
MTDTQNIHPFQYPVKDSSEPSYSRKKPSKEQSELKRIRDRIEKIEEQQAWEALWGKDTL